MTNKKKINPYTYLVYDVLLTNKDSSKTPTSGFYQKMKNGLILWLTLLILVSLGEIELSIMLTKIFKRFKWPTNNKELLLFLKEADTELKEVQLETLELAYNLAGAMLLPCVFKAIFLYGTSALNSLSLTYEVFVNGVGSHGSFSFYFSAGMVQRISQLMYSPACREIIENKKFLTKFVFAFWSNFINFSKEIINQENCAITAQFETKANKVWASAKNDAPTLSIQTEWCIKNNQFHSLNEHNIKLYLQNGLFFGLLKKDVTLISSVLNERDVSKLDINRLSVIAKFALTDIFLKAEPSHLNKWITTVLNDEMEYEVFYAGLLLNNFINK